MSDDTTNETPSKRPCPDCRKGTCHRCGQKRPDALPAPHMGVILCNDCMAAALLKEAKS